MKKIIIPILFLLLLCGKAYAQSVDFIDLARIGTIEQIDAAVKRGIGINKKDKNGTTALGAAAELNPNPQVLTYLIRNGARVDIANNDGETPLILAAKYNPNAAVVAALTRKGANVNTSDKTGRTALMWAVLENVNAEEIVKDLIATGADKNKKDKKGRTAWDYAKRDAELRTSLKGYLYPASSRKKSGAGPIK